MILLYTWQLIAGLTCTFFFGWRIGHLQGQAQAREEDKKWDAEYAEKFKAWQKKEMQP